MAPQPSVSDVRRLLAEAGERQLSRLLADLADDPRAGVQVAVRAGHRRLDALRARRRHLARLYATEDAMRAQGLGVLIGVDEVGRGALAGPLTAAAVALPPSPRIDGLDDSKRLTPERRAEVAARVREVALGWAVVHIEAAELDAIGMAAALRRAMTRAIEQSGVRPDRVLVDGLPLGLCDHETAFVGGDGRIAAIAAASCVAKVSRDALMCDLDREHPGWGFTVHKGYSTPEHLRAIRERGLSPVHRRSFAPCTDTLPLF